MNRSNGVITVAIAIFASLGSGSAHAEVLDDLKAQLEAAKRTIQVVEERIKAIEEENRRSAAATPQSTTGPAPPEHPTTTAAGTPAVQRPALNPELKSHRETEEGDKPPFEVYGFVQADGSEDFDRVDPSWNATLRPSKIPVNCPVGPWSRITNGTPCG